MATDNGISAKAAGSVKVYAAACQELATLALRVGRPEEATQWLLRAREPADRIYRDDPTPAAADSFSSLLQQLGDLLLQANRLQEADECHRQALELAEQVHRKMDNTRTRRNLACAVIRVGTTLLAQGKDAEGVSRMEQALQMYEEDYNHARTAENASDLARSHFVLGQAFVNQRDMEKAIRHFRCALSILNWMAAQGMPLADELHVAREQLKQAGL